MDERTRELLELANTKLAELSILFSIHTLGLEGEQKEATERYRSEVNELINTITAHLKETTNV
jgi:hypothetical protein